MHATASLWAWNASMKRGLKIGRNKRKRLPEPIGFGFIC
jgi:hypothetical protein